MNDFPRIALGCVSAGAICVAVQWLLRNVFDRPRYNYLRDLLMAGAWVLLALWFGGDGARFVVGAAFIAAVLGLAEKYGLELVPFRFGWLPFGLFCAVFGPSIEFISFVDGEYIYLSPLVSIAVSTLWFAAFPAVVGEMDGIPGLVGHVLAVTFSLMLVSVVLGGGAEDALFMSVAGSALICAFWSRLCAFHTQLGRPVAAMWGALVAGTSVLGVSKGIVFSSMLFLSLGMFAIPFAEASLRLVSMALTDEPTSTEIIYRRLMRRGLDHPDAVRVLAGLCAVLGAVTAVSQYPPRYAALAWWGAAAIAALVMLPLLLRRKNGSPMNEVKPSLWGVPIDSMSLNYACARARGLVLSARGVNIVATVNALGMDEAVRDPEYHGILCRSAMVLSDGVGLLWGLRFLGMSIRERVTGIDFAEQLCRLSASEGWGVYFLGSRGDTARACAEAMAARYPGLAVKGARDGYFGFDDPSVADEVMRSGAKVLFVAMGIPRQEKWIARHADRLGNILAVGVGGAFDVLSGHLRRAPEGVQRFGLEWLFRLIQEPNRWRKDMRLFAFVARIIATRLGLYRYRG
ncbi:MAG: WecB/TagA/CpsF family glycosyltransferase [Synergistaceae bacterium]|jgi:N-acetylglucosaminyldiphosphoundecaprenol N-acetyl-beta-D-mannosaminyltransferase|nr:WecB/TagA/CpsF family glycosyltransferase [Synergistaceae bacterium]